MKNIDQIINKLNSKKYVQTSESNADTDCTKKNDLQAPLKNGWKRETIFETLTKTSEIEGQVFYYSPGSQRKLQSIQSVQKVDKMQSITQFNQ